MERPMSAIGSGPLRKRPLIRPLSAKRATAESPTLTARQSAKPKSKRSSPKQSAPKGEIRTLDLDNWVRSGRSLSEQELVDILCKPPENRSVNDIDNVYETLKNKKVFREISREACKELLWRSTTVSHQQGQYLFKAGDIGEIFYFIIRGAVSVQIRSGDIVAELSQGEGFGELALIKGGRRSATVIVTKDSVFLCITKADYDKILKSEYEKEVMRKIHFLKSFPFFKQCQDEYLRHLASRMQIHHIAKGKIFLASDNQAKFDGIAFVEKGILQATRRVYEYCEDPELDLYDLSKSYLPEGYTESLKKSLKNTNSAKRVAEVAFAVFGRGTVLGNAGDITEHDVQLLTLRRPLTSASTHRDHERKYEFLSEQLEATKTHSFLGKNAALPKYPGQMKMFSFVDTGMGRSPASRPASAVTMGRETRELTEIRKKMASLGNDSADGPAPRRERNSDSSTTESSLGGAITAIEDTTVYVLSKGDVFSAIEPKVRASIKFALLSNPSYSDFDIRSAHLRRRHWNVYKENIKKLILQSSAHDYFCGSSVMKGKERPSHLGAQPLSWLEVQREASDKGEGEPDTSSARYLPSSYVTKTMDRYENVQRPTGMPAVSRNQGQHGRGKNTPITAETFRTETGRGIAVGLSSSHKEQGILLELASDQRESPPRKVTFS